MYKLFIVDDEKLIRERLANDFDWASMGFAVCGTAGNGLEALQRIDEVKPDLVLTDMVMPVMGGLELIDRLQSRDSRIGVVVLSGYSDFENVRAALQMGALDYLLKPVNPEEVTGRFEKIIRKLDADNQAKRQQSITERILEASRKELPWKAAQDYLTGQVANGDAFFNICQYFGLELQTDTFTLAFLSFNTYVDRDILQKQVERLCTSCAQPLVVPYRNYYVLLFNSPCALVEPVLKSLLDERLGESTPLCILTENLTFSQLPEYFRQFTENLHAFFYQPTGRIVSFDFLLQRRPMGYASIFPGTEQCVDIIRQQDEIALLGYLEECFQKIQLRRTNPDVVIARLAEIYMEVATYLVSKESHMESLSFAEVLQQFQQCQHFRELCGACQQAFAELFFSYQNEHSTAAEQVQNVKRYIQSHFSEDISLAALADKFHINASYLSTLFSRLEDKTMVNYIRDVRLEKAAELLKNSNMRITQIAVTVGYPNYRYFCKLFKSQYNVVPREYRVLHGGHETE